MNILYSYASFRFTDKEEVGGEEKVAWGTVYGMAKRGHICYVMSPEIELSRDYENIIPIFIKRCAFRKEKNKVMRKIKAYVFLLESYKQAKKLIKKKKIDVIHHIRPSYPGFFSPVSGLGVPFVLGGITVPYREWNNQNKRISERIKIYLWNKMLSNSSAVLFEVKEAFKYVPDKYRNESYLFYNGVDTQFFYPSSDKNMTKDYLNILFVGRLMPLKGIDVFLEAVSILSKKLDRNFRVKIAGWGEIDRYKALCVDKKIDKIVDFCGVLDRDKLRKLYQSSDIFVLPSRKDNGPNSLLEAMSCGLPVIASNVMGIPEIVSHDTNGLLVPPSDPVALADAIEVLMLDDKRRQLMSENNRQLMVSRFDWNVYVDRLEKVYRDVQKSFSYSRK
ncbi:glycosyltransferase family 4 protein [Spirochaetia bacterium 38H-sp]|uniref:Glycosyltransferase family 4 protein n=1 Tax=Rarispira pelagica TaxID=3141764 RepID=A0ABU9U9X1_9SPIR